MGYQITSLPELHLKSHQHSYMLCNFDTWIYSSTLNLGHIEFSFPSKQFLFHITVQFSSVTQLCPTLCDPTDCSTPGFPVSITNSRSLLKLMSIALLTPSNHPSICSVQFSRSVESNSLRTHESQDTRPPITNSRSLLKLMSIHLLT